MVEKYYEELEDCSSLITASCPFPAANASPTVLLVHRVDVSLAGLEQQLDHRLVPVPGRPRELYTGAYMRSQLISSHFSAELAPYPPFASKITPGSTSVLTINLLLYTNSVRQILLQRTLNHPYQSFQSTLRDGQFHGGASNETQNQSSW